MAVSSSYEAKATDDQVSWGFLKGYLELLLFCQQYGTIKVPRAINKSLNEWLHNQCTYIGDYKKQKAGSKFWDNKEDRYVNILNALGVDYMPKT